MNAKGTKRVQPLSLQKISLEVILESKDIMDSDIKNVIKKAEDISPVWLALKNNVEINVEYKIIDGL